MMELPYIVNRACKALLHAPAFTCSVIAALVLPLTVNAAVFGLLDAVLLRRAGVMEPDRVVELAIEGRTAAGLPFSLPLFHELDRRQTSLNDLFGWMDSLRAIDVGGGPRLGTVLSITGNYFPTLGQQPMIGRLIGRDDVDLVSVTAQHVAVVGYTLWQREFGGDPAVLGRTIAVEGVPFRIIGVTPRRFRGLGLLNVPDVIVPLTASLGDIPLAPLAKSSGFLWIRTGGRLREGVSETEATAQLRAVWPSVKDTVVAPSSKGVQRENFLSLGLRVESLAHGRDSVLRPKLLTPLRVLQLVSLATILISCVNVAMAVLARWRSREPEFALRMTLGASRARAVREAIAEGGLLVLCSVAIAVVIGNAVARAIAAALLANAPVHLDLDIGLSGNVLMYEAAIAVVLLLCCVGLPVIGVRPSCTQLVRIRSTAGGSRRAVAWITGIQLALCCALLGASAQLAISVTPALFADRGFEAGGVTLVTTQAAPGSKTARAGDSYLRQIVDAALDVPQVEGVALAAQEVGQAAVVQAVSEMDHNAADGVPAAFNAVSPEFFDVLRIRLVQGRKFAWTDTSDSVRVAIISRSLAARMFHGASAIGRRIRVGTQPYRQGLEVVGVVEDATINDPRDDSGFAAYVPIGQFAEMLSRTCVLIRGNPPPSQARRAVEMSASGYIVGQRPLTDVVAGTLAPERLSGVSAGVLAGMTLLLALVGIAGNAALSARRTRGECAVRAALGASPQLLALHFMSGTAVAAGGGAIAGVGAAWIATEWAVVTVPGLRTVPMGVLVIAPMALWIAAMIATLPAAIRVSAANPAVDLRKNDFA